MFGSYYTELAIGAAVLALAAVLWHLLLRAFRREPRPAILQAAMVAEFTIVFEVGLVALGVTLLINGMVEAIPLIAG